MAFTVTCSGALAIYLFNAKMTPFMHHVPSLVVLPARLPNSVSLLTWLWTHCIH